jgi:bifunctional non-homologous end joining protein LigD
VTAVTFTNLDRVLWPEAGRTKGDLVEYYRAVAPWLLPHLADRHLTLWRFPEGVHRGGFWQNECRGAPAWMRTAEVRGQRFCVVDDLDSLLWLANLSTVELHPFLSTVSEPERPTAVVFDLDPGPAADILDCREIALRLRERVGLDLRVKTSGSVGLHLAAPVDGASFEETKALARGLAEELAAEESDRVTAMPRRLDRGGRVFVDWLQNNATRSTVAPYSLRGAPFPTVSTPVTWDELEAARRPEELTFLAPAVLERLERHGDLWADMARADTSRGQSP